MKEKCDLREFNAKVQVFDQSRVLQKQIEDNEPYYASEIEKLNERMQKIIEDRKKKIKEMQNKFADITPVTEDLEKRLQI